MTILPNHPPPKKSWYTLDNAAKIYPVIRTARWNPLFRLSVMLREDVDPERLQQALALTLPRFPHIGSRLRRGLFWYYIQENPGAPAVQEDVKNPCMAIRTKTNNHFHFRVRYHRNRIAVELFHSLTDGSGGLIFLKTLTAQYLMLGGADIPATDGVLDCLEKASPEELEDSYIKYADLSAQASRRESRAFHVPGPRVGADMIQMTTGVIPTAALKEAAKARAVSVTELLTATLLHAVHRVQREIKPHTRREIKVSVPVNMRSFYPSKTLRNFSLFINVGIDPGLGAYSFDEILKHVHHTLRRDANPKTLNAMMAMNVGSEKNPFVRVMPLFLKKASLRVAFRILGERQFSCSLSNLGVVTVPEGMKDHVSRFDAILGPPRQNHVNVAVVSYGGTTAVTFTRDIAASFVERYFFARLVKLGIPVKIESNER